ncbi:VOC family protein [Nocardioides sp. ChNu-153]|uniref:VOC family protein n=1 Tax=unclassified Nocardioides TaxID=2615069 RepID=UPI002405E2C0|nr:MULTISPECIES: VOC family protein [unclassified Nocardioides]MDF9715188.1 VOC family protein [Nocardioides sp. ChNu-99]MDN7121033.1 VOC family protein [Nocardioides sp. ChNu-153]
MSLHIVNICVDCADPRALAAWWGRVLELPVFDDDADGDDEETGMTLPDGRDLLFLRVPEPKTVKNRLHLCLAPSGEDDRRDAEVERLLGMGATLVDDLRAEDGTGWAVLADPEGNEFCVLRGEAERAGS